MADTNNYMIVLQAEIDESKLTQDYVERKINTHMASYRAKLKVDLDLSGIKKQIEDFKSELIEIQKNLMQTKGTSTTQKVTQAVQQDIPIETRGTLTRLSLVKQALVDIQKKVGDKPMDYTIKTKVSEDGLQRITKLTADYRNEYGQMVREIIPFTKLKDGTIKQGEREIIVGDQALKQHEKKVQMLEKVALAEERIKNLNPYKGEVQTLKTSMANLESAYKAGDPEKIKEAERAFIKADGAVKALGKNTLSFTEEMGTAIRRTIEWSLAMGVLYGSLAKIKEGITYIADLNKEMTNIQVVMGNTDTEISKMADGYNTLAKQMGVTTLEIVKGSLEFIRQGKTIQETEELLKSSMMLSKLGNVEAAQSTEYLTSALNGFQLQAEDAVGIVDKLVSVDNVAATSVSELASALQRSANSASQAGVSMEELVAYIGTVSSITRKSSESIGESFKTIFARMQNIKLKKYVDENGESLSDVETILAKIGITLRNSEGNFRSMSEVLAEVAGKWKTLNSLEQSATVNAIAGEFYARTYSDIRKFALYY